MIYVIVFLQFILLLFDIHYIYMYLLMINIKINFIEMHPFSRICFVLVFLIFIEVEYI